MAGRTTVIFLFRTYNEAITAMDTQELSMVKAKQQWH